MSGAQSAPSSTNAPTSWAFLSDVHGNLPALRAALEVATRLGATRFAFLGDLLGRGDSDGVIQLIAATASVSVQGNRDLDWAERVSARARVYVLGLPPVAWTDGFACAHGDPRVHRPLDVADVRRGATRTYEWLRAGSVRLGFFGHTHQARVWRKRGPQDSLEDVTAAEVVLEPNPASVYLVNVGTVGLPFGGKGPPSLTLFDGSRLRIVEFLREPHLS